MFKFSQAILFFSLLMFTFTNGEEQQTWCVAKPSSTHGELVSNLNYVCSETGIDCEIIQEGGECYYPTSKLNHASIVMNIYYKKMGGHDWNCYFSGSGLITLTNPSYLNCAYI